MDIKCPHCGTEYEIDKSEYGRYAQCEVCGKGFVIGATTSRLSSAKKTMSAVRQSASRVSSSPTSSVSSVSCSRPFAGKIGNGAARPFAPSSNFKWLNPFAWGSVACACLLVMVVFSFALTSKSTRNRKVRNGVRVAQVEDVERNGTTTSIGEVKEDSAFSAVEPAVAAKNIQVFSSQTSESVQRIKNEPAETQSDAANGDESVAASDNDVKTEKNIIQAKNPLGLFKFGDARNPQMEVGQDGTI